VQRATALRRRAAEAAASSGFRFVQTPDRDPIDDRVVTAVEEEGTPVPAGSASAKIVLKSVPKHAAREQDRQTELQEVPRPR